MTICGLTVYMGIQDGEDTAALTLRLFAVVGDGRTLKNDSSLPCVDPWRALVSFLIPERILSSLP